MSSVLRALKKLEQVSDSAHPTSAGPGMAGVSRQREKKITLRSIVVFVLLLLIGVEGVLLIKRPFSSSSVTQQPAAPEQLSDKKRYHELPSQKINAAGTQSGKVQAGQTDGINETPVIPSNNSSNETARIDESIPPTGDETTQTEERKIQAGKSLESLEVEAHRAGTAINSDAVESIGPAESATARTISPSQENSPAPQRSEEFSEIDESAGLELQAISWAPDPKKSIAVINNRICREKETVNGFVIQKINDDDVIVSNGDITGQLLLKIR